MSRNALALGFALASGLVISSAVSFGNEPNSAAPSYTAPGLLKSAPQPEVRPESFSAADIESTDSISETSGEEDIIRERFPNGTIKIERHTRQDKEGNYFNHGPWTQWDEKGKVMAQGEFQNGKRQGKWMRWYSDQDGQLFSSPALNSFQKPLRTEAEFANGQLHGTWSVYDTKDRLVCQWQFENGQREGRSSWFHPNGRVRQEVTHRNGQPHGELVEWDANEKVTSRHQYIEGRRLVSSVAWHAPEKKKASGWKLMPREANQVSYNWWTGTATPSGAETGEGQKHGQWTYWYENGQIQMVGAYEFGVPIGKFAWWYSNGQKQCDGDYVAGKRHGPFVWWHPTGQKQLQGQYASGVQNGKWRRWGADGKIVEVGEYGIISNAEDITEFAPVNTDSVVKKPAENRQTTLLETPSAKAQK